MGNILTLLRLEIKNKYGSFSGKNPSAWIRLVFSLGFAAAVFIALMWASEMLFSIFARANLLYESLVLFLFVVFLFLFFTGVSSVTKVLYFKGDNEILMRFPVTGSQVFWAKTLFLLFSQFLITTVVLVPFLIAYANVVKETDILPQNYYTLIPTVVVFMVFIPFFLSNVLAIPFMHFTNKIRHKFGFIIISLAVLMTALFFVYTIVFEKIVLYLQSERVFSVFSNEIVLKIREITRFLVPARFFAGTLMGEFAVTEYVDGLPNILVVGENRAIALLALIIILEVLAIGTFFIIKYLYQKTLLKNVEIEGSAFTHKTKDKRKSIFATLLHKEFLQVFRSVNYSFQYFVLACSMPVMVFFCNRIAIEIGKNSIGYKIIPGLTLLIMLIFNTVIISFSATSITREGNNFYHTKVMPVSVRTQLAVKFFMYILVSFIANTVTILITIFSRQMMPDPTQPLEVTTALEVYLIVLLVSIGLTLFSMRLDVRKPRFNLNGEGELVSNNANTTTSVLTGFIISISFGIIGMLSCYLLSVKYMFYIVGGLSFVFFIITIIYYCVRLVATYNRIT